MWLPIPHNPISDTTVYTIQLKQGYSRFPTNFSGVLKVWNPECTIPLDFASLTSSKNSYLEPNIQRYPNPANDQIKVSSKSNVQITSLKVYSSYGKLISYPTPNSEHIDISEFASGFYIVAGYSSEKLIDTDKLIKN